MIATQRMGANVRAALMEFLASPSYGLQKQLCYKHNVPRSTLSQAIVRAKKTLQSQ